MRSDLTELPKHGVLRTLTDYICRATEALGNNVATDAEELNSQF